MNVGKVVVLPRTPAVSMNKSIGIIILGPADVKSSERVPKKKPWATIERFNKIAYATSNNKLLNSVLMPRP